MTTKELKNFSPQWFLKALGNGGLAVSFFMYLMFMIEHQGPMPVFSDIYRELTLFNMKSLLVGLDLIIILYFTIRFLYELQVQLSRFKVFKKTSEYQKLKGSNNEISLMTIPLTLAMGINVLFIFGAVYIPNLWSIVEYLFPLALLAFFLVGIYALKLLLAYFMDTLAEGNFDYVDNNNLNQMIAPFTFIMISVGIAAPAAMSHTLATNIIGFTASIFFLVLTLLLTNVKLILGFKSIFRHGINDKAAPTLWIVIPIMTLTGITLVRLISGLYHHILHMPLNPTVFMVIISVLVSVQIIFGLIGYGVLKKHNYFKQYVRGKQFHVGSYALICPGVAMNVLGMFFIHFGFVKTNIIDQFGIIYFLMFLPIVYIQVKTVLTLSKINKKSLLSH